MGDELENRFVRSLIVDVIRSLERVEQSNDESDRRDTIRTVIAAVEGLVGYYKDNISSIAEDISELSDVERSALSESVVTVDRRGQITQQTRHLPTLVMIRLVTNIAIKIDPLLQIDFGAEGWQSLSAAINVRNRITHPKTTSDLIVTGDDVNTAITGLNWVLRVVEDASAASTRALKEYVQEFNEVVDALERKDPKIVALYEAVLRERNY